MFDFERLSDIKHKIREGYENHIKYEDKRRNRPRMEACRYTAKKEVKDYVYNKYGKKCLSCGSTKNISIDHIIPIHQGGKNKLDNLQPLCKSCNSKKGIQIIDYREEV